MSALIALWPISGWVIGMYMFRKDWFWEGSNALVTAFLIIFEGAFLGPLAFIPLAISNWNDDDV